MEMDIVFLSKSILLNKPVMFYLCHLFLFSYTGVQRDSCGAVSADPSGAPLLVSGVHVVLSLVFCVMFYG
jgi:hypothetical protein